MAMELIETIELTASAASIEFTSIPQDGVDLLLVVSLRSTSAGIEPNYRFNSDTGSNYSRITLGGDGATASSSSSASTTSGAASGFATPSGATANTFSNGQLLISNYTSSSAKSISIDATTENNATTAYQRIIAASYAGTSPITSFELFGLTFVSGSTASLYKIY